MLICGSPLLSARSSALRPRIAAATARSSAPFCQGSSLVVSVFSRRCWGTLIGIAIAIPLWEAEGDVVVAPPAKVGSITIHGQRLSAIMRSGGAVGGFSGLGAACSTPTGIF
jgi:hypothetical protein